MIKKVIPTYRDNCVTSLLSVLLGERQVGALPISVPAGGKRVLFIIDGLGWEQLQERKRLAPTLSAMSGGSITTVAPSTTATALTSITTALSPAEHGIVGYRFLVDGYVLNALRWSDVTAGDLRKRVVPSEIQPYKPFLGYSPSYVMPSELARTGLTEASLRGGRLSGYRTLSALVCQVGLLLERGEDTVYCYYNGLDKVAHEYGLGEVYDAELAFVDRLVKDILTRVPSNTTVMVSADHGQVDCGGAARDIDERILEDVALLSGEGRFRWLHAKHGRAASVAQKSQELYSDEAWVVTREQVLDEAWFGYSMSDFIASRLGDVALVPFKPVAYDDPDDSGSFPLIGRHGSVTSAEMYVPCLAQTV